jgi:hypothetical protein
MWSRLAYHDNTPKNIQTAVDKDNVSGKMIEASDYFYW